MTNNRKSELLDKLNSFINKYYLNKLVKGCIYFFSVLFVFFLLFSFLEYFARFNVINRTFLFWGYISISAIIIIYFIVYPTLQLLKIGKIISHKEAAKIIGVHFPEVDDKLLNVIELEAMNENDNALINASIEQKISAIKSIKFNTAIDLYKNKKHIKWLAIPLLIVLLLFMSGKEYIITESSARIINHNMFFEPKPPFNLFIKNDLKVIQYNDWVLDVTIKGREIPSSLFIETEDNIFKLSNINKNRFSHTIKGVTKDLIFYITAGGYKIGPYKLEALTMPKIIDLEIKLNYPEYTGISNKIIKNNGDISAPEGTIMDLNIKTKGADYICIIYDNDTLQQQTLGSFNYKKHLYKTGDYKIITSNKNNLQDTLYQSISITKDKYPKITVAENYDSISSTHLFNGEIEDDYLTSKLVFNYEQKINDSTISQFQEINIKQLNNEKFFFQFNFNELNLNEGDNVKYYFTVWDNDKINGHKKTNSASYLYEPLSKKNKLIIKDIENKKTRNSLSSSIELTDEIKKDIEDLKKALLEKKEMGWEEKKKAEELLKKHQQLEEQIKHTQQQNSKNITNQKNLKPEIFKKQKELENLMKSLLNDEEKELLKEMKKMIEELNKEKLKSLLDKLNKNNTDLEKELERELELFKQLDFEQKVEEAIEKVNDLKELQNNLLEKTENKKSQADSLAKTQDELIKKMNSIEEDLEELRKKNMELENKNTIPETKEKEEDIKESMKKSHENLINNKKQKSKKSQQEAVKKIEELENDLLNMQAQGGSEQQVENMEALRQILENLITVSFDQEDLMAQVKITPRKSSKFVTIIQLQKILSDNSKIIEDSLFNLSKRVVQIQSTINKEISSINNNITKSIKHLEERDVNKSIEKQQFTMTAINNLALLLSEILEQMQRDLDMQASQCNKPRNCNKPKNCNSPSMSELNKSQKKLNQKIKKKKNGKKDGEGGRGAKELVELSKQQEEIRRRLMELRDELGQNGEKGKIDKILEDMEENETDIINNNITIETINRQREILTRLLEAEKATREQDEDDKRSSNEWLFKTKPNTKEYLDYIKEKKAQEELLKTIPVQLKPYYKKKVTLYFNNLIEEK